MRPLSLRFLPVFFSLLPSGTDAAVEFNRDIRPILSDKCFACHGPDAATVKGGLRLDGRTLALKPTKSGALAIVPGKPEESELIKRIHTTDEDDVMPPPDSHKSLTAAEKRTLETWIKEGAEYKGHWAFEKPVRPEAPSAGGHPVDAFLNVRLAKEGLRMQPEAPRETLIRRVVFDATGLPPTQPEVDQFLADTAPDSYERMVDRYLSSPHYGEHMAAHWLDLARYADSNGFQTDTSREQWVWRDWVINAFNANMPYDRFTIEQLAGDMLPNAAREQIIASGFNRNHRLNGEGGRIEAEWFAETVIDRVETTGLTWMGLTLNCCRCHDHKYDPVSQKEFYQFFAYFNSNDESGVLDGDSNSKPLLPVPKPGEENKHAELRAAVKAAEQRIEEAEKELPALQAAWEPQFLAQFGGQKDAWRPLLNESVKSEGGATLTRQPDGTWLASGKNPDHEIYIITAPLSAGTFTGVQIDALPDASLPAQSVGRFSNGNYVLSDIDAEITAPGLKEPLSANFISASADYEQKGWEVELIVKDKLKRGKGMKNKQGWAVDGPTKKEPRTGVFACTPIEVPNGAQIKITLRHDALAGHNIGRFKVATTSMPPELVKAKGGAVPTNVLAALQNPVAQRTTAEKDALTKFYRANTDNPAIKADAAVAGVKKSLTDYETSMPTVMVMQERAQPRDAFILKRGEYDKPGDKVARALPAVLPPLPAGAPNNRLGLAQWLVSGEHPLTARVWVNRLWERFFGLGLVKTSENLGMQADHPSHPELLDWLATEFVRVKWDMKAMQRLILTSEAYRQSSRVTRKLLEQDPENRLLARGPRIRLSAEAVRDQMLALSGLLVDKKGGPSVRPYMPLGVWDETSVYGNMRNYRSDQGEGLYRRTLYTIWKRTAAPPVMQLFDSPSREICTVKRSRTNTPLQALALLNEITSVESARRLAERIMKEGGTEPAVRIAWAFRQVTGRRAPAETLALLQSGYEKRLTKYTADPAAAQKLITQGDSKPDAALDAAQLAAFSVTANVLLNMDEVVTRE